MNLAQFADLLLDSRNPRDAAERTLRWMKDEYAARSVSLWRREGHELLLELSIGLDQEGIASSRSLWMQEQEVLGKGQPGVDGQRMLVPITNPSGAYVYLDGVEARRIDISVLADAATVAINALRRRALAAPGRAAKSDDLRREELLVTLRLHEWNLARVARVMHVSRKTVYDWLEKYEIPREKVRRS